MEVGEIPGPSVGEETRALTENVSGGTEATVYLRSGECLFRFTATGNGDPMADLRTLLCAP
jgi:hypothetical protein